MLFRYWFKQIHQVIVYQEKIIMESIKGKNILIAGATGSIGTRLATMLSISGANLFLTGRNEAKLEAVALSLKLSTENYFACDLSLSDSVSMLQKHYFARFDTVDILINASGIGIIKQMEMLDEKDFMQTIQANLLAPWLLMKSFLPAMKELKKGLIINIPGVLGKVPMAGAAAYSASKFGLVGMMQSIREELKRTDIRITNLFLGGVDSAFWDNIDLRVQRDKMIQAEEAAKAIWFLCQQPQSAVISEMVLQPFNHQPI